MAASVSAVRAMLGVLLAADTTNHLTEPPRRAVSMEVISPIPPGGEMTTTSGCDVAERAENEVNWVEGSDVDGVMDVKALVEPSRVANRPALAIDVICC